MVLSLSSHMIEIRSIINKFYIKKNLMIFFNFVQLLGRLLDEQQMKHLMQSSMHLS